MQSLNPTRIIHRQGREIMIIGALVLIFGLFCSGSSLIVFLLVSTNNLPGYAVLCVGVMLLIGGIGVMVRGLTLRLENQPALAVADTLGRELDSTYTFIRNVSRPRLGYIDAVLVGLPGALVFRIVDTPGIFLNEGADWLERKGAQNFALSRLNATRECVTDIHALRKYLNGLGLSAVPVFGVVVFANKDVQLSARQPVVPIAQLLTLSTVLRRDFLSANRIDSATVEATIKAIYN